MNRTLLLLLAVLIPACDGGNAAKSTRGASSTTRPAIPVDPPPSTGGRDYEGIARELYKGEPGYEAQWPVEFHIRIVEGITQDLNRAIIDLGGNIGPDLFAPQCELGWGTLEPAEELPAGITASHWKDAEKQTLDPKAMRAHWLAYLGGYRFLERAQVKVKTNPKVTAPGVFEGTASIEIAGRESGREAGAGGTTGGAAGGAAGGDGGWRRDYGKVHLAFAKGPEGKWRITKFVLDHMTTERRAEKIFADVTGEWIKGIPEDVKARLTRQSASDEIHARLTSGEAIPGDVAIQPVAMDAHPGVVVLDVDADGWDDLFVWDVLGKTTLLRNMKGQGFEEASERFGLALRDVSAMAFADLDGDGVLDAVVGRWFGRSEILRGVKSKGPEGPDSRHTFLPSSAGRMLSLPSEVASLAIADVNRDGRLDILFGTAAHDYHGRQVAAGRAPADADAHVGQLGPPDTLLLNRGENGWEDGTKQAGLTFERNTLSPSFADFNGDDWPDLYIGNDFARAHLLVNEKGKFKDVSKASGADQIIYGMGASWADFDGDGDLDLYASAMQSSAGARIMSDEKNFASNLDETDRSARKAAARGNTLLRNDGGGKWTDATADAAWGQARGANWAYGAQMIDFDSDGWLDAFSPNGFFTAPGNFSSGGQQAASPSDGLVRDL